MYKLGMIYLENYDNNNKEQNVGEKAIDLIVESSYRGNFDAKLELSKFYEKGFLKI